MIQANCNRCGKIWQVPDAKKAYSCKECGGQVNTALVCHHCEEGNPPDSLFCEKCGQELGVDSVQTNQATEEDIDFRLAKNELARLRRAVHAVRSFYIITAVFSAFFAVIGFLLMLTSPEPGVVLAFLVTLCVLMANIAGALRVTKEPFFWALSIASLNTIATLLILPGRGFIFQVAIVTIAVALWACVSKAGRAQKILDAHPNLSLSRSGTRPNVQQTHVGKSRLGRQAKKKRKELLVLGGIIAVVLIVGLLLALLVTADPTVDKKTQAFEEAWLKNDTIALSNLFAPEKRAKGSKNLARTMQRRGWTERPPTIGEAQIETEGKNRASVTYKIGSGQLITRWKLSTKGQWQLLSVETAGFVALSGPEQSIARFKSTWESADTIGLIDSFALEQAGRARRIISRAFRRPGWQDNPPKFLDYTIDVLRDERIRVTFRMQGFEMPSTWECRSPFWKIVRLKIPRP